MPGPRLAHLSAGRSGLGRPWSPEPWPGTGTPAPPDPQPRPVARPSQRLFSRAGAVWPSGACGHGGGMISSQMQRQIATLRGGKPGTLVTSSSAQDGPHCPLDVSSTEPARARGGPAPLSSGAQSPAPAHQPGPWACRAPAVRATPAEASHRHAPGRTRTLDTRRRPAQQRPLHCQTRVSNQPTSRAPP